MESFIGFNLNTTVYPEGSRKPVITHTVAAIVKFANFGVVSGIIAMIGICANTANIATFVRLGFQDTINISLTALAVADMAHLISLLSVAICFSKVLCDLFCDRVNFEGLAYVIGAIPRHQFVCTSGFITSFVAFERCVCVFKPLQVRSMFSKRKNIAALVGVFMAVSITFAPVYSNVNFDWVFNPKTNVTLLDYFESEEGYETNSVAYQIITVLFLINYGAVTLCTAIIVWKLSSQSAWRASQAQKSCGEKFGHSQQQVENKKSLTGKDRRATQTVVLIATLYIVCSFPGVTFVLTMSIVPDFNVGMLYTNIYDVVWSCAYLCEGFCSCANIFVYLSTSSRFKEAFWAFFKRKV